MSDGPIPLISPDDLSFVAAPTFFADLVAQELGDLGTDADGFDELFNEAAIIAGDMANVLESFDGDLNDAVSSLGGLDTTDTATIQADLQPASDALDTTLAAYNANIPPIPESGTSSSSAPTCQTTISQPGDGCIGKVTPGGTVPVPGDAVSAIENAGFDPTTMLGTLGAYLLGGFGGSDSITAAQLVQVSGGAVKVTLAQVFQGGAIQKNVTYLQFALDPASISFGGVVAVQVNNQKAWYTIQYLFQN